MRVLALDIGHKRVGIAVSDEDGKLAFPLAVLSTDEVRHMAPAFRRILEDYQPALIVSGLPQTLSGDEGPQAVEIRELASEISRNSGIPVEFFDERLSSVEAKRIMREQGLDERHARGSIDKVAASLFLTAYLDSHEG